MIKDENRTYPFQLVAGNGLGTSFTSLEQIGDIITNRPFGLAALRPYINMTNGNLTLRDRQFCLKDIGEPFELGYTYNSLAKDIKTAWRLAPSRAIKHPEQRNQTTLIVTEKDGHETTYTLDPVSNRYLAPGISDGTPYFTYDPARNAMVWYHPKTRVEEVFNQHGDIEKRIDALGNVTRFDYDASHQIAKIEMPSGTRYHIERDGNKIDFYREDTERKLLHRYELDSLQRVVSSKSADSEAVTYCYDEKTQQLNQALSFDKTSLRFSYQSGVIRSIQVGDDESCTHHFTIGDKESKFIDACGNETKITLDTQGRLEEIKQNMDITRIGYSSVTNHVKEIVYPDQSTAHFLHDEQTGLITQQLERDGNVIELIYDEIDGHQLLVAKIQKDDKANKRITKYVYEPNFKDGHPVLAFTISPGGRVTEFISDKKTGLMVGVRHFIEDKFPINDAKITHKDMLEWQRDLKNKHRFAKTQLSTLTRDKNGRIKVIQDFNDVNELGVGCVNEKMGVQIKEWDDFDNVIREALLINATMINGKMQTNVYHKSFARHNAWGLLLESTDGVDSPNAQTTIYQHHGGTDVITHADQHNSKIEHDSEGLVKSITEVSDNKLQKTQFERDENGRIIVEIRPDNTKSYFVNDDENDTNFQISALGHVIATKKNTQFNYEMTLAYDNPVDLTSLHSVAGLDKKAFKQALNGIHSAHDRRTYRMFDPKGRDRFLIDALNHVIEFRYDKLGNQIAKIEYNDPLSDTELHLLLTSTKLDRSLDRKKDRISATFYDNDGLKIAEQDPDGYITKYEHDARGKLKAKQRYNTPDLTFTNDYAQLTIKEDNEHDAHQYFINNNRGQCEFEIDAEGYITQHYYHPDGKKQKSICYENPVLADWYQNTSSAPVIRPSDNDHQIEYLYDELSRLIKSVGPFDIITTFVYDKMNREIASYNVDRRNPDKINGDHYRGTEKRYDELGQVIALANPLVAEQLRKIDLDPSLSSAQKDDEKEKNLGEL